jgi:hypothetical protein
VDGTPLPPTHLCDILKRSDVPFTLLSFANIETQQ